MSALKSGGVRAMRKVYSRKRREVSFSSLKACPAHPAPDGSLGPYFNERFRATLTNVWRRRRLVIATVAVALVIGIALALTMPKRYTAEAYVRDAFKAEEATLIDKKAGIGAVIAIDASMLVQTQSRLLQSRAIAQRVVQRLGLERIRPVVSENPISSWLQAQSYGDVAKTPEFQEDLAARKLLSGLSVRTEPRVYLIVVNYTAGDPELAALITNAFVVELLQTITLQSFSQQLRAAERSLSADLATLGEQHPKVVEEKMRIQAAEALLRVQLGKTTEEIEHTASSTNVTFARADTVPSSPNPPFLIGVALLFGLGGGVALASFRSAPSTQSDALGLAVSKFPLPSRSARF